MINNQIYYEVSGNGFIESFDTLENAIIYANENNCFLISEIGGSWLDFEKCLFCGGWFVSTELNKQGDCWRCEQAIKDHNGFYNLEV
jgi:hypothetical protein